MFVYFDLHLEIVLLFEMSFSVLRCVLILFLVFIACDAQAGIRCGVQEAKCDCGDLRIVECKNKMPPDCKECVDKYSGLLCGNMSNCAICSFDRCTRCKRRWIGQFCQYEVPDYWRYPTPYYPCGDPPTVDNSDFKAIYPGKSKNVVIQYTCKPLYYLSGPLNITCISKLKWSTDLPKCIKAVACPNPPPVDNGRISGFLEPNTVGPKFSPPERFLEKLEHVLESENAVMDDNHKKVNSRIQYECNSTSYKMVGSKVRTCLPNGQWSGRHPSCHPVCGKTSLPRISYIVNGTKSEAHQWPWQVLIINNIVGSICGGSLVSESWVVTAAHCLIGSTTKALAATSDLQLFFGRHHYEGERNDQKQFNQYAEVDDFYIHPDYDIPTDKTDKNAYDSDIVLVRLAHPVNLTHVVQLICLPDARPGMSEEHLQVGKMGHVAGWGRNVSITKAIYPDVLQQVELPIVSNEMCREGYGFKYTITDNMFCAGYNKSDANPGTCTGDSGGPFVMAEGRGDSAVWYQEGVVSWGSPKECGIRGHYPVFTKVSNYIEWIREYI